MTTIKERLQQFIRYKRLSSRQFEIKTGLTNGYVGAMSERSRLDRIECIFDVYPELSRSWLLTGEGSMLNDNIEELKPVASGSSNEALVIKTLTDVIDDQREQINRYIDAITSVNRNSNDYILIKELINIYEYSLDRIKENKPINEEILKKAYNNASRALDYAVVNKESTQIIEAVREAEMNLLTNYTS